jgi:hypothetical protein
MCMYTLKSVQLDTYTRKDKDYYYYKLTAKITIMLWVGRPFCLLVGGPRRPNGPTGNTAIRTEIKLKNRHHILLESPLFPVHSRANSTRPHHRGFAPPRPRATAMKAACCTALSVAACFPISPPPLPLTTEFFEPTRRGPRRMLPRGVLHHAQPLACHHPASPLHPNIACWLS